MPAKNIKTKACASASATLMNDESSCFWSLWIHSFLPLHKCFH
ncbi:hypothetical protein OIU79_019203 [Salix purpurea]|uniref:Uncharacterized protein n=1 Tax=Salix purpurea TaxID=77065 RepID=A0A9Q0P0L7_SALPP|nr:hypothetical protein OIU79_019203 [Salix purpurea]